MGLARGGRLGIKNRTEWKQVDHGHRYLINGLRFELEQQGKTHGSDESRLIYSVYVKKMFHFGSKLRLSF